MGQFEKIVVLSVIGLIAVILVVALHGDEDPLAGLGNRGGEVALEEGEELHGPLLAGPLPIRGRQDDLRAEGTGAKAPDPAGLDLRDPFQGGEERSARTAQASEGGIRLERDQLALNAGVRDPRSAEAEVQAVEVLPIGAALVTLRGLEDTWEPDLKQYTCRRGDGLRALARRFYGDERFESLLRQFNEGVDRLEEGQVLLLPVFDPRGEAAVAAVTDEEFRAGAGVHLVGEGESLWSIAVKHYGKGTEWQRIFDANRDRLAKPDALRAGMNLRIP
jgi:LysM repeat protein